MFFPTLNSPLLSLSFIDLTVNTKHLMVHPQASLVSPCKLPLCSSPVHLQQMLLVPLRLGAGAVQIKCLVHRQSSRFVTALSSWSTAVFLWVHIPWKTLSFLLGFFTSSRCAQPEVPSTAQRPPETMLQFRGPEAFLGVNSIPAFAQSRQEFLPPAQQVCILVLVASKFFSSVDGWPFQPVLSKDNPVFSQVLFSI